MIEKKKRQKTHNSHSYQISLKVSKARMARITQKNRRILKPQKIISFFARRQ